MNQFINKNKGDKTPEDLLDQVLRLHDEGKSVSDILVLFPDHKEELSQIFKSINVLKKQKNIISAPKEFFTKIVSNISFESCNGLKKKKVSAADVTNFKNSRYIYESDYIKGRFFAVKIFNSLKLFTMKKMYVGIVALLLVAVVAGVSYRQFHRGGVKNNVAITLPGEETNELVKNQEDLAQDILDLEGMAADDESLNNVNQDLADISGEQINNNELLNTNKASKASDINASKTIDVAYLETLESNFGLEIAGFSSDSRDLEGISGDTSLSSLDSELGGI
ncbi:MAG: hypothetical protein V1732_02000 [Patescibacteria group bacterium]|nr:hypothetical protein [Patescibacteria group bacterium]MBU4141980.1 hypothetical protein [Patescibacteria group bacterium]